MAHAQCRRDGVQERSPGRLLLLPPQQLSHSRAAPSSLTSTSDQVQVLGSSTLMSLKHTLLTGSYGHAVEAWVEGGGGRVGGDRS